MHFKRALVILLIILCSYSALAITHIPDELTVPLYVTTAGGSKVNGIYTFTFKIYNAPIGGASLFSQTSSVSITNSVGTTILANTGLDYNNSYWLGITMNGGSEMTPRINITKSPYAHRANISELVNWSGVMNSNASAAGNCPEGEIMQNTTSAGPQCTTVGAVTGSAGSITASNISGWGFYNSLYNFTGNVTDALYCIYNGGTNKIDCNATAASVAGASGSITASNISGWGFWNNITNISGTLNEGQWCAYNGTHLVCNITPIIQVTGASGSIGSGNVTEWGFYNNIANITGSLTDVKLCFYDQANNKINCTKTIADLGAGGTINGSLIVDGNFTVIGTYINATVTNEFLNGSIIPEIDNLFNLGSTDYRWANIYANNINSSQFCIGPLCITSWEEINATDENNYTTNISITNDSVHTVTLSIRGMSDLTANFQDQDTFVTSNNITFWGYFNNLTNFTGTMVTGGFCLYNGSKIECNASVGQVTGAAGSITANNITEWGFFNSVTNSTFIMDANNVTGWNFYNNLTNFTGTNTIGGFCVYNGSRIDCNATPTFTPAGLIDQTVNMSGNVTFRNLTVTNNLSAKNISSQSFCISGTCITSWNDINGTTFTSLTIGGVTISNWAEINQSYLINNITSQNITAWGFYNNLSNFTGSMVAGQFCAYNGSRIECNYTSVGTDGSPGSNGTNGTPGTNGTNISITSITWTNGNFSILWSNGQTTNSTNLTGPQGIQGLPGTDGSPGSNGTNGTPGSNGTNYDQVLNITGNVTFRNLTITNNLSAKNITSVSYCIGAACIINWNEINGSTFTSISLGGTTISSFSEINNLTSQNITAWGYYNNITNFTGTNTAGGVCVYNGSKIECNATISEVTGSAGSITASNISGWGYYNNLSNFSGSMVAGYLCTFNGSRIECNASAVVDTDTFVTANNISGWGFWNNITNLSGTLNEGQWCAYNGTHIVCNVTPIVDTDTDTFVTASNISGWGYYNNLSNFSGTMNVGGFCVYNGSRLECNATSIDGTPGSNGTIGINGTNISITSITWVDGNFSILWSNGQTTNSTNLTGPQGVDGSPGTNGTNGIDGSPGTNGTNGTAGSNISIVSIAWGEGNFTILWSNGNTTSSTNLTGPQGLQGLPGSDGSPGTNGTPGSNGTNYDQVLNITGNVTFENLTLTKNLSTPNLSITAGGSIYLNGVGILTWDEVNKSITGASGGITSANISSWGFPQYDQNLNITANVTFRNLTITNILSLGGVKINSWSEIANLTSQNITAWGFFNSVSNSTFVIAAGNVTGWGFYNNITNFTGTNTIGGFCVYNGSKIECNATPSFSQTGLIDQTVNITSNVTFRNLTITNNLSAKNISSQSYCIGGTCITSWGEINGTTFSSITLGGITISSWAEVNKTDTPTHLHDQALNTTSNVTFNNVTATGYLAGQPLTGMMGSGIIHSNQTNDLSEVNITCSGLTCSYNDFEVRIADDTSSTPAKYCKIPAGSQAATDNAHNVFYIDNSCNVVVTTIETWFNSLISQGGQWDFANMVCYGGNCEIVNGVGLEQRRMMKQRVINFNKNHLSVTSGFTKTTGVFPAFTIATGDYIYLMGVVNAPAKTTGVPDSIEVIVPNGTGWYTSEQTNMNYTYCTNGTASVLCGNTPKYRRVFFFMVGWNESGTDNSELHQLLPSNTVYYSSEATCLDTVTSPLTYTLPDYYVYAAVPLWAYCIRPTDSAWSTNAWIDLRTVKVGTASASSTGDFVPYAGATQNVDLGSYNLTTTGNINTGGVKASSINVSGDSNASRLCLDTTCVDTWAEVNLSFTDTDTFVTASNISGWGYWNNITNLSGTLNSGSWCAYNGTHIVCNVTPVTQVTGAAGGITSANISGWGFAQYDNVLNKTGNVTFENLTLTRNLSTPNLSITAGGSIWLNGVGILSWSEVNASFTDTDTFVTASNISGWGFYNNLSNFSGSMIGGDWCIYNGSRIECNVTPFTDTFVTANNITAWGFFNSVSNTTFVINAGNITGWNFWNNITNFTGTNTIGGFCVYNGSRIDCNATPSFSQTGLVDQSVNVSSNVTFRNLTITNNLSAKNISSQSYCIGGTCITSWNDINGTTFTSLTIGGVTISSWSEINNITAQNITAWGFFNNVANTTFGISAGNVSGWGFWNNITNFSGTMTAGQWCAYNGSRIECNVTPITQVTGASGGITAGNISGWGFYSNITNFTSGLTDSYWCYWSGNGTKINCNITPITDTFVTANNITGWGFFNSVSNSSFVINSVNISGWGFYYSESNLTGLLDNNYLGIGSDWVNITGDTMSGNLLTTGLNVSGRSNASIFCLDGVCVDLWDEINKTITGASGSITSANISGWGFPQYDQNLNISGNVTFRNITVTNNLSARNISALSYCSGGVCILSWSEVNGSTFTSITLGGTSIATWAEVNGTAVLDNSTIVRTFSNTNFSNSLGIAIAKNLTISENLTVLGNISVLNNISALRISPTSIMIGGVALASWSEIANITSQNITAWGFYNSPLNSTFTIGSGNVTGWGFYSNITNFTGSMSASNWCAYNGSRIECNVTPITQVTGAAGGITSSNITGWGFWNNITNFTGSMIAGDYCVYNGSRIECNYTIATVTGAAGGITASNISGWGFWNNITNISGILNSGQWCAYNGTHVVCNVTPVTQVTGAAGGITSANISGWGFAQYDNVLNKTGNVTFENLTLTRNLSTPNLSITAGGSIYLNGVGIMTWAEVNGSTSSGNISGSGTINTVPKFTATGEIHDSNIIDDGTSINITNNLNLNLGTGGSALDIANSSGWAEFNTTQGANFSQNISAYGIIGSTVLCVAGTDTSNCINSWAEVNSSSSASAYDQVLNITGNVTFENLTITEKLALDTVKISSWSEVNGSTFPTSITLGATTISTWDEVNKTDTGISDQNVNTTANVTFANLTVTANTSLYNLTVLQNASFRGNVSAGNISSNMTATNKLCVAGTCILGWSETNVTAFGINADNVSGWGFKQQDQVLNITGNVSFQNVTVTRNLSARNISALSYCSGGVCILSWSEVNGSTFTSITLGGTSIATWAEVNGTAALDNSTIVRTFSNTNFSNALGIAIAKNLTISENLTVLGNISVLNNISALRISPTSISIGGVAIASWSEINVTAFGINADNVTGWGFKQQDQVLNISGNVTFRNITVTNNLSAKNISALSYCSGGVCIISWSEVNGSTFTSITLGGTSIATWAEVNGTAVLDNSTIVRTFSNTNFSNALGIAIAKNLTISENLTVLGNISVLNNISALRISPNSIMIGGVAIASWSEINVTAFGMTSSNVSGWGFKQYDQNVNTTANVTFANLTVTANTSLYNLTVTQNASIRGNLSAGNISSNMTATNKLCVAGTCILGWSETNVTAFGITSTNISGWGFPQFDQNLNMTGNVTFENLTIMRNLSAGNITVNGSGYLSLGGTRILSWAEVNGSTFPTSITLGATTITDWSYVNWTNNQLSGSLNMTANITFENLTIMRNLSAGNITVNGSGYLSLAGTRILSWAEVNGSTFPSGITVGSTTITDFTSINYTYGQSLNTTGNVTFENLTLTRNLSTVNLSVSGNALFQTNMTVWNNTYLLNNLSVLGNMTVGELFSNNLTVSGNLSVTGNITAVGNITISGSGFLSGNSTCAFIYSPTKSTRMEICD